MLIPTDALDIVPRSRLMATITLADSNIFTTRISRSIRTLGHRLGNHFKVHHIVARRRLMTLRAVGRPRRGMLETGNCPLRSPVALSAILPEEFQVSVLVRVTARAV